MPMLLGLRIGVGKRFPPFGIQKYEVHKYGRRMPGVREVGWKEFRVFLEKLERKYGVPLYYKSLDFGIRVTKCYLMKFREGDIVSLVVVSPGRLRKEVLAVDRDFEVVVTIVGVEWTQELLNRVVRVKVVESYDTICIAKVYG